MKSFRTSSLSHIFKAISTIITDLKEYCSDPTEANFETMKGQSQFMLAILIRASRKILHLENLFKSTQKFRSTNDKRYGQYTTTP